MDEERADRLERDGLQALQPEACKWLLASSKELMAFRLRFAVAAIACVLAAGWATQATGHPLVPESATQERHYTDPAGWSLTYPESMFLERSEARLRRSVFEVTIVSFAPRTAVTSWQTSSGAGWRVDPPLDAQGEFPSGAVAFRILRLVGGPLGSLESPESDFPLQLASFTASSVHYPGTSPPPLVYEVVAGGSSYSALAWIGESVPLELRAALERVVSSVSFPPLQPGTTVGHGFTVLEPSDRYPVGSFTPVRAGGQPFYLVHAPGGFYGVGWRWQTLHRGYKSRCRLELDTRRLEFFCTNFRARWDRVGRVIVKPRGAERGDPLNIAIAKVGWDGHVLLHPGTAAFANARLARDLWPDWRPSR
jgi:hypothetical protein